MRHWKVTLLAAVAALVIGSAAYGADTFQGFGIVHVVVNGKTVVSDVPAVNFYGRTMLPVRAIAEALGLDVKWDGTTSTATLTTKVPGALGDAGAPPFTFSGKGPGTSTVMTLSAGLYLVKATNQGEDNFIVKLYDAQGEWVALPANVVGNYDGSQLMTVRNDGRYVLNIDSDGVWSVTVTPVH